MLVTAIAILGVFLLSTSAAFASDTEYHYTWQQGDTTNAPDPFGIVNNAGVFESASFSYDTATQIFGLEFTIGDPGAPYEKANFFTLVLTPGYLPLMQCYNEAAVLYVDASGAQPIITAYSYVPAARWESKSWETGDPICSSLSASCGNWVNVLEAVNNPDNSRTFRLSIDASAINAHIPSSSNSSPECTPYTGIQFSEEIGIWLFTYAYPDVEFTYGNDGFIDNLFHGCWYYEQAQICDPELGSIDYQGMFDGKHFETFQKPYCTEVSGSITVQPGDNISYIVTGKSPDGDPLTVTYSGVPAGATITPTDGTTDSDGMIDSILAWTPGNDAAGQSFTITYTFTEQDGTATCELDIDVSNDPFCEGEIDRCGVCNGDGTSCLDCEETSILSSQFSMDSNALLQLQNIRRQTKTLVRLAKGTSGEATAKQLQKSLNKDSKSLYQEAWTSTWTFDSLQQQCTNQIFCVSVSNISTLDDYVQSVDALFDNARKVNREIQRIKKGGKAKKLNRQARNAREAALASAALIPNSQDICEGS